MFEISDTKIVRKKKGRKISNQSGKKNKIVNLLGVRYSVDDLYREAFGMQIPTKPLKGFEGEFEIREDYVVQSVETKRPLVVQNNTSVLLHGLPYNLEDLYNAHFPPSTVNVVPLSGFEGVYEITRDMKVRKADTKKVIAVDRGVVMLKGERYRLVDLFKAHFPELANKVINKRGEEWKDIVGYKNHQISNYGRVKNIIKDELLPTQKKGTFLFVTIDGDNLRIGSLKREYFDEDFLTNGYKVYILSDNKNSFYVGITSLTVDSRIKQMNKECLKEYRQEYSQPLYTLLRTAKKIVYDTLISGLTRKEAQDFQEKYVKMLRRHGINLMNLTDGGVTLPKKFMNNLTWAIKNGFTQKKERQLKENKIDTRKPVYQYDKEGNLVKLWNSTLETSSGGFQHPNVYKACKGELNQHKGFIWSYTELSKKDIEERQKGKRFLKFKLNNGKKRIPVYQYNFKGELVKKWDSILEPTQHGYLHSAIYGVCIGRSSNHAGYIWSYTELNQTK